MPIVNTCIYGPTSFITNMLSFLHSGYSVKVNHTCMYARQVLLGL